MPTYSTPPITEAVIGINFTSPIDPELLLKLNQRFDSHYPHHQPLQNFNVKLAFGNSTDNSHPRIDTDSLVGHRRSSADMTQLVVFFPTMLVVSQLAPYPGWTAFFNRFVRDWEIWKKVIDFHRISRVGVRYINRIDIPVNDSLDYAQYLNLYPRLPIEIGSLSAYAVQTVSLIEDIGSKLTMNTAVIESPILNHTSFLLDQDIAKEIDPPQRDEAIYALLGEIRNRKNAIFEACITERARELFND